MTADAGPDPLPSGREGSVKRRLLAFITAVSTPGDPAWVAPQERSAVFDNDGTLWSEQPLVVQLALALQRLRSLLAERAERARHPGPGLPYTALVYLPMLELLALLRARECRSWIVTGGGVAFVPVFAEETHGIPPEWVIGSTLQLRHGEAKPVGIARAIGRRLGLLLHHDDGEREMAHDRASRFGHLDQGLELAQRHDWSLVSLRRDWDRVFPSPPTQD